MFSRYLKILRIRMKPIVINYQYQASYLSIQKGLLFQLIQTLQAQRTQLQDVNKVLTKEIDKKCKHFKRERCKTSTKLAMAVGHVTALETTPDFLHDDHFFRNNSVKYISSFLIINSWKRFLRHSWLMQRELISNIGYRTSYLSIQ